MSHRLQITDSARPGARKCAGCARHQHQEFDSKTAYENLSRKYVEMAGLMTRYINEAPLARAVRNEHALHMAKVLTRIVGGVEVNSEHPDCCLIGESFPNGASGWFCTGVLIHPRIVLTAGHCQAPPDINITTVALGADDQNRLGQAEIIPVYRKVVHPLYRQTQLHGDMTVVILRRDSSVTPVPVATTAELQAAEETLLVGFGNSDVHSTKGFGRKRKVEVDITHIRRSAGDHMEEVEESLGFDADIEFVAGGEGYDSCNGDSGGPAYVTVLGRKKLAGLTSRATETATNPCGDGGIYTRVDQYMEFIAQVAKDAGITLA